MTASRRWAEALQEWAIPADILACAPVSPWGFPTGFFVEGARRALAEPPTPTHQQITSALRPGGVLLDVGCGGGAASLPVAPPASLIVAVDQDARMLQALAGLAAGRVAVSPVEGLWPEVAHQAGAADVVVCANVAYNVAALGPFVAALGAAARHLVVVELTAVHPQSSLSPLWEHFWRLPRPTRPTAEDAAAVITEVVGRQPQVRRWRRSEPPTADRPPSTVDWIRRRLCLPEESDAEVAALLAGLPELGPSDVVTLSWPGTAQPCAS